MGSKWCAVLLACLVVGCGAAAEPAREEASCDVRLPSAKEMAAGEKAARRYERLERQARAVLRRLQARDDGTRTIDADTLARGQRSRREEGFVATPEATRAVLLGSAGLSSEFGFPITQAEFRLLDFRGVIGEHSELATRYVARCLRADNGGVFYGGDERGQFLGLPLTTGSTSARAELAKRTTMGERFLRTPKVRWTAAELKAAKVRISDEVYTAPDFRSISPNISSNRVRLRIAPYTQERADELRARYGPILRVEG